MTAKLHVGVGGALSGHGYCFALCRCLRMIFAIVAVGMGSSAWASGYLTLMGQGVPVTSYVMNSSVPSGSSTGMTLFVGGSIANPDGCNATDKIHIPSTVPNYNALVAAIIAAVSAGQSVGFWSSGCSSIPFWGGTTTYPLVWTLWVVP